MGYSFQFVTLAGLPRAQPVDVRARLGLPRRGMAAYSELQEREFAAAVKDGFTAVRHQREVGTGYFDAVAMAISAGGSSTLAMAGSTEAGAVRGTPGRGLSRRRTRRQEEDMTQEFWVVGGHYRDTTFTTILADGGAEAYGPFALYDEALRHWSDRSNQNRSASPRCGTRSW